MSGHPGVCAPPPAAVVTVIACAPARSPRTAVSHAGDQPNKPSSATSQSAQVSPVEKQKMLNLQPHHHRKVNCYTLFLSVYHNSECNFCVSGGGVIHTVALGERFPFVGMLAGGGGCSVSHCFHGGVSRYTQKRFKGSGQSIS